MKLRLIFLVVFILCFSGCVVAKGKGGTASEGVISLPQARKNVIKYHESGRYIKEVAARTVEVAEAVDKAVKDKVMYPSVVMVVEDVLLSTYPARRKQLFSSNNAAHKALESEVILSSLPGLKPSVKLFDYLVARNIPVFLVSYRAEDLRIPLMENLVKAGYSGWKGLYMLPANYPEDKNFCEEVRKGLEQTGFKVIVTAGVFDEDVSGEFSGKPVLFPNYIYSSR